MGDKTIYWSILVIFTSFYLFMFAYAWVPKVDHVYSCHTDMECYEECVQIGGTNCE